MSLYRVCSTDDEAAVSVDTDPIKPLVRVEAAMAGGVIGVQAGVVGATGGASAGRVILQATKSKLESDY